MFGGFCRSARGSVAGAHLRSARRASRAPWVLLSVALLLGGCRLDLAATAVIDAEGGGSVALVAGFDAAMLDELDALGIDPTAELEAVAASSDAWDTQRRLRDDGGLEVVATRAVDDVARIGAVLRELSAGLSDADPALLIDVEVSREAEGGVNVAGTAQLRSPATAGIRLDDVEVGPDAAELAALVAGSVDAELRLAFPGPVVEHDGARLEGRTVVWELPADVEVEVGARAAAPSWWASALARLAEQPLIAAGAGLAVLLLVLGAVLWRRSRRATVS